jgi:hypothetical protein
VPKSADEACKIDPEAGTDLWTKSIVKEMAMVKVAFARWDGGMLEEGRGGKLLAGFQEIGCHVVFDAKTCGDFTRNARLVAGDHKTVAPASKT